MSHLERSTRRVALAVTALAVAPALALTSGPPASASTGVVHPSRAATGQCTETWVPLGADKSFKTKFWGSTIVHFRNPGAGDVTLQWSTPAGSGGGDTSVSANSYRDLNRSFVGLPLTIHPWGDKGVWVSFPFGPC